MPNIRILFVPSHEHALQCGEVFDADNLEAAGYSVADMIARGDVEPTDAEPTAQFDIPQPPAEPEGEGEGKGEGGDDGAGATDAPGAGTGEGDGAGATDAPGAGTGEGAGSGENPGA